MEKKQYLICFDNNNDNILMEIIHISQVEKELYKNKNWTIIGEASDRKEVLEIVQNIIVDNIDNIYNGKTFRNNYSKKGQA